MHRFFLDGWNVFDFTIVALSLLPAAGPFATVARLARLLRALRVVSALPELRLIVATMLRSIPSLANVVVLLGLILYVYAVVGVHLFAGVDPGNWGSLPRAGLTLFEILTLEGWVNLMNASLAATGWASIYYVSFVVLAVFVVINLFIAISCNQQPRGGEAGRACSPGLADRGAGRAPRRDPGTVGGDRVALAHDVPVRQRRSAPYEASESNDHARGQSSSGRWSPDRKGPDSGAVVSQPRRRRRRRISGSLDIARRVTSICGGEAEPPQLQFVCSGRPLCPSSSGIRWMLTSGSAARRKDSRAVQNCSPGGRAAPHAHRPRRNGRNGAFLRAASSRSHPPWPRTWPEGLSRRTRHRRIGGRA